jgi:DNA helicase-2/ATP-dependent DNA helicase PcrA
MTIPTDVNQSQWKAIRHAGSHLLIVAGPGTGKTHTLIYRIAHLSQALSESKKILAITFTNKAAWEMKERLAKRLDGNLSQVFVGTFHAFGLDVLRRNSINLEIATPEQIKTLLKDIWPEKSAAERKECLDAVSYWKAIHFDDPKPLLVTLYDEYLRSLGLMDFDDILIETLNLVRDPVLSSPIKHQFQFIFVDEYQDINPLQHCLLRELVEARTEITAIGDPNQAIYGFRGSNVEFFKTFVQDFPGTQVFSLDENFRSAKNLLNASTQVIQKDNVFDVPPLTAKIYEAGRLIVHESATDKAEAEFIVHQIEKMVGGTSMFSQDSGRVEVEHFGERTFGDIAVLYRLNRQKNLLREAFERSGIPFEINGDRPIESEFLPEPDGRYEERTERVRLMTLHASKGLEFPVVFIVGCEETILPLDLEGFKSDEAEERRLFYVGMTRAKEQLFLVHAKQRVLFGSFGENKPSRFLSDIEESLKACEVAVQKKIKKKKENNQLDLFSFS